MSLLLNFVRLVDATNEWIGRTVSWLTLGAILVCFLVVLLRYGFSIGYPWMQELYVWQHASVFMLGAGYTMLHRGHVSVDIFYGRFTPHKQAWIDIICVVVFLFPWLAVLAITSTPFILASWSIQEASAQVEGLPGLYLFKTLIWLFCAVLFIQGLALIARRSLFLMGHSIDSDEAAETAI